MITVQWFSFFLKKQSNELNITGVLCYSSVLVLMVMTQVYDIHQRGLISDQVGCGTLAAMFHYGCRNES